MECKIYKKEEQKASRWTGGTSTQLAIYPEDSSYLDRRFVWRLSTAECGKEESTFSKLPDYDRVLLVLEGEAVLAHEGVRVAKLGLYQQDAFDGACSTKSFGTYRDYNLMVRKGNKGSARVLEFSPESSPLEVESCGRYSQGTQAIYVEEGFATVTVDRETVMVAAGQQLVVNYEARRKPVIKVMGEGTGIHCSILYDYQEGQFGPVEIPAEGATLADFRECVFIANTQYRFSKYTNRRLKKLWYDEALQEGIRKINRFYLSDVAYCLELLLLFWIGNGRLSGPWWIVAFGLITLLHLCFISPAMYFLAVPKPVGAHMKDIDKLTPYEQERRAWELGHNERVERILGRYKFTGTATYDENGNRTDDYYSKKL